MGYDTFYLNNQYVVQPKSSSASEGWISSFQKAALENGEVHCSKNFVQRKKVSQYHCSLFSYFQYGAVYFRSLSFSHTMIKLH